MKPLNQSNINVALVDFKIENYKLSECQDWQDFKIKWSDDQNKPICIATEWESIKNKKEHLFLSYEIECDDPVSDLRMWGIMDYLFLNNPQIPKANTFKLVTSQDNKNLKNFRSILEMGKFTRCITYESECTKTLNQASNDYNLYSKIMKIISDTNYFITPLYNNVELVDAGTKRMNINVYFRTSEIIGLTSFMYEMVEASVYCSLFSRSFPINSPQSASSDSLFYLEYIQIICAGILSLQLYMKYLKIRSIKETLNNSFFFVMFLLFFVFEYIFKIMQNFKGTIDYVFLEQLINESSKRELIPYYLENVKIFKSFSIIFLSYHLIYVVFDIKYLVVFTSFLKPVFQRFLIVLCLIILSLSLMIMAISGRFYLEFSSFSLTFFNLLNYVLGVDSPTITDDSTFPATTVQTRFYFQVASYALRILVLNFTLIIMFHMYRKNDIKKIRAEKK